MKAFGILLSWKTFALYVVDCIFLNDMLQITTKGINSISAMIMRLFLANKSNTEKTNHIENFKIEQSPGPTVDHGASAGVLHYSFMGYSKFSLHPGCHDSAVE
jgi:hypothetical protein